MLREMGMDMSTAIRVYLKKIVQSRSIPFPLEATRTGHVSVVSVDEETQRKMDDIVETWMNLPQ